MMILTDNSGAILATSEEPWRTPGEYTESCFRIAVANCPAGRRPVAVTDFGEASGVKEYATWKGATPCSHVYENATITFEEEDPE